MTKIFENKKNILREFIEICNNNSLWYSLDNLSLLACINKLDFWNNIDHYEVFMTFQSYEKLKELFPNKILDSVKHSDYFSLQNKFVHDINLINQEIPFLNINIIIPTTVKKIKKFFNLKNKIKAFTLFYSSMQKTNIGVINQKIRLARMLKPLIKNLNYKDIFENLYDENYEGFIISSPLLNKNSLAKWLTNTNYQLLKFEKDGLEINVIAEYQNYLRNIYGNKWKELEEIDIPFYYTSVKDIKKN